MRGAWGTAGRENGDGRLPGFWEVGTWRTGYASTSYAFLLFFFFICRRGHEPRKFRIRPDAAGTERSINFIFFLSMVRWFAELAARFRNFPPPAEYNISCIYIIYIIYLYSFFFLY